MTRIELERRFGQPFERRFQAFVTKSRNSSHILFLVGMGNTHEEYIPFDT